MKYHILNGDALAERFPSEFEGEVIVFRECLIDGPVSCQSFDHFLKMRDRYLSETYPVNPPDFYQKEVQNELNKLTKLTQGSEIYLWFEEDLFCLMNAWFVLFQLSRAETKHTIYWVHTPMSLQYGFAGLTPDQLSNSLDYAIEMGVNDVKAASDLWKLICNKQYDKVAEIRFSESFEFLNTGVKYLIDFKVNRAAEQILKTIISNYNTPEFGKVFREFHSKTPEFGLGDLQVKRLYDEILTS